MEKSRVSYNKLLKAKSNAKKIIKCKILSLLVLVFTFTSSEAKPFAGDTYNFYHGTAPISHFPPAGQPALNAGGFNSPAFKVPSTSLRGNNPTLKIRDANDLSTSLLGNNSTLRIGASNFPSTSLRGYNSTLRTDASYVPSTSLHVNNPTIRTDASNVPSTSLHGNNPTIRTDASNIPSTSLHGNNPTIRTDAFNVPSTSLHGNNPTLRTDASNVPSTGLHGNNPTLRNEGSAFPSTSLRGNKPTIRIEPSNHAAAPTGQFLLNQPTGRPSANPYGGGDHQLNYQNAYSWPTNQNGGGGTIININPRGFIGRIVNYNQTFSDMQNFTFN